MTSTPGSAEQWRTLVGQAEVLTGCVLGPRVESYLINLLIRLDTQPVFLEGLLELDRLTEQPPLKPRNEYLQEMADQCLLFAGLFPELAEQRMVRLSQFVSLGRTAYHQLHELVGDECKQEFAELSTAFTELLDLLHAMRELCAGSNGLTLLHAYDLWCDTGSPRALRFIRETTGAFPVHSLSIDAPRLM